MDNLTPDETEQLCTWTSTALGGPRQYTCGDGHTGTVSTVDACMTSVTTTTAHCLVSLVEDSVDSTKGDPCLITSTQTCATYVQCVLGG
jgi:hypothetical protein